MQQRGFIRHKHQQQPGRVNTKLSKSTCVNMSSSLLYRLGSQPQQRSPFARKQGEHGSDTGDAARILIIAEEFVQPPARQPTAQHRVDTIMPQRKKRKRRSRTARFQFLQTFL
jgi:hypothetical protein